VRNAQKELQAAKPPKSSRLLYRYLKTLFIDDDDLDDGLDEADDEPEDDSELDD